MGPVEWLGRLELLGPYDDEGQGQGQEIRPILSIPDNEDGR